MNVAVLRPVVESLTNSPTSFQQPIVCETYLTFFVNLFNLVMTCYMKIVLKCILNYIQQIVTCNMVYTFIVCVFVWCLSSHSRIFTHKTVPVKGCKF